VDERNSTEGPSATRPTLPETSSARATGRDDGTARVAHRLSPRADDDAPL